MIQWPHSRLTRQIAQVSPRAVDSQCPDGKRAGRPFWFRPRQGAIRRHVTRSADALGRPATQGGAYVRCTHVRLPWASEFNAFSVYGAVSHTAPKNNANHRQLFAPPRRSRFVQVPTGVARRFLFEIKSSVESTRRGRSRVHLSCRTVLRVTSKDVKGQGPWSWMPPSKICKVHSYDHRASAKQPQHRLPIIAHGKRPT